ncbi:23S rRNA (adenine(2030)-N(6))-methyltransferase RlmJ [Ideonella sp. A 288]|uniref:23S rRNA (adenine(2030)-N(6))-methyltransferase RlmJ n=1 Tax=Ideonella sp. A 288 TaxID=1962181 RepID=UPI000B4B314C|nr:23S rRNA (adenine(2030)-N(6))-methyltransferase RlmJ [Ideonella sp. A 288]
MLAYRHAFHAGNHADVLKHTVLLRVLQYLNQKDKPYRLVDTHAGAGGYSLTDDAAQKKGEYLQGIARLWKRKDAPAPVAEYVDLVRQFNAGGELRHYPGSPTLAHAVLRAGDQLRLFELHPADFRTLQLGFDGQRSVQVFNADGFAGLKGQVPPAPRRGAVLIDPSYEGRDDYAKLVSALRDAVLRFPEGTYVVWYPQVSKLESARLPKQLKGLAPKGWLHATLSVQKPDAQGFGLAGSGVFVINPPFTLHAELATALPWLAEVLGQYDGANWALEQKVV